MQRAQQLKRHFTESLHDELVGDLKRSNTLLDVVKNNILDDSIVSPSTRLTDALRRPFRRIQALRRNARSLFETLSLPRTWRCQCKGAHNLLLRLDADQHHADQPASKLLSVPQARIASVAGKGTSQMCTYDIRSVTLKPSPFGQAGLPSTESPHTSRQVPAETQRRSLPMRAHSSIAGASTPSFAEAYPSATWSPGMKTQRDATHPQRSTVTWNLPDMAAMEEQGPEITTVEDHEIHGLCAWFHSSSLDGAPQHDMGLIPHASAPQQAYKISISDRERHRLPLVTLHSNFCDIGYYNRKDYLQHDFELSMQDRLLVAATIASSTFQLQGTWLRSDWTCHDVVIPLSTFDSRPLIKEIQVITAFPPQPARVPSQKSNTSIRLKMPEHTLEPLGAALCNILLGHNTMSAISAGTTTFQDALALLYDTWGRHPESIANAVRECVAWSGPTSQKGFDDDVFGSAAFEKVIWPIVESFQIFEGRTSSALNNGGRQYGTTTIDGDSRVVQGNVYGDVYNLYNND